MHEEIISPTTTVQSCVARPVSNGYIDYKAFKVKLEFAFRVHYRGCRTVRVSVLSYFCIFSSPRL